jgi:hypothetical protein
VRGRGEANGGVFRGGAGLEWWFHGGPELVGVQTDSGGVLGSGGGETAKGRRERVEGILVVPMCARGESGGLYPMLSTAATRWRPAGGSGCVARQGRHSVKAKGGGEGSA